MSNWEYIIGENIKFSPSTESLNLIANPEISILLTPACSRLLQYLLSEQGIVITREAIFLKLWSQYGNTPSNSSLNTYVSQIRKSFMNLGEENDVIITIPKMGFLFNPDLKIISAQKLATRKSEEGNRTDCYMDNHIKIKNDSTLEEDDRLNSASKLNLTLNNITNGNNNLKLGEIKNKYFYYIFSIILFILIIQYSLFRNETLAVVTPVNIGVIDNCSILFLPLHGEDSIFLAEENIQYIIKKSNFTCESGGIYYLYTDKRSVTGKHGKIFVSYCDLRDKSVRSCRDYIGINVKLPHS